MPKALVLPRLEQTTGVDDAEQHSIPQTVLLHLLPGALILLVFVGLSQVLGRYNLPPLFIFLWTLPLALVPTQLGLMGYLGWKRNGRPSLEGIVLYREPIKAMHYFWLVPLMFGLTVALLIAVSSFSTPIYWLFGWWPASLNLNLDLSAHSKGILLTTYALSLVGAGLIGPTVEEFYFRGFLLPRLSRFGKWAPLFESFLFALYHFWSPWMILERAIAWLPMTYLCQYRRNIYVAVIVHCAINSLLSIPLLLEIMAL